LSVQEVLWEKCGTVRAGDFIFFYGRGNEKFSWGMIFGTTQKRSAVKRGVFVNGRMSYIVLRGRRCNIIVLNEHSPTEEKIDD
jgi:hypothetical protein